MLIFLLQVTSADQTYRAWSTVSWCLNKLNVAKTWSLWSRSLQYLLHLRISRHISSLFFFPFHIFYFVSFIKSPSNLLQLYFIPFGIKVSGFSSTSTNVQYLEHWLIEESWSLTCATSKKTVAGSFHFSASLYLWTTGASLLLLVVFPPLPGM